MLISFCLPVYAAESDGRTILQKGKCEFDKKNYEEAVSDLLRAEKEFPLLGDYALLWLSDAYHESGNYEGSLSAVRSLLKKYPNSSLLKKARAREIKEAQEISAKEIRHLFEAYLKDYPGDAEVKYLFAQWLKNNGGEDKAKSIFKELYREAGLFSVAACAELSRSDIGVEDMVKRASNLTRLMDYKGAESLLRSALAEDDGGLKAEILRELGQTLFKQKRYREAAETYRKAKDRFWEVRSLYRAGKKDAVDAALDDILKNGERLFSPVLLAVAADKRREGKPEEALKIYQTIMKRFPSDTEEALWGIGWTHFLSREYQKAAEVFSRLYTTYEDPKYLYWRTRSLEAGGLEDPKNGPIAAAKRWDFYSVMLYIKGRRAAEPSVGSDPRRSVNALLPVKGTPVAYKKIERVEALLDLGLKDDALAEMVFISKRTSSVEDILYVCSKAQELGEYKLSVRSAIKVPYTDELHDFLYPRAHWDTVKSVSAKYAIDPLLVLSIVREESRFDSEARSPAGAVGLMQLMPYTAERLDGKLKLGIKGPRDLLNAENNLRVGAFYLSHLIKEFGSYPYAIAAYNAGQEIVRKWIQRGGYKSADEFIEDIPYAETRNYVKRVLTSFFEYKRSFLTEENGLALPFEKL